MPRIYKSARRAAREAGIDEEGLQAVEGSGLEGAVTKNDVEVYLDGQKGEKPN